MSAGGGGDYRDVVIETLAHSEAALLEQVNVLAERAVRAEAERDAYRLVAVQAVHHSHDLYVELVALRERYRRGLEDASRLREQLLEADERRTAA